MRRLEAGKYYHLYNRGNNREPLFIEARTYEYFLKLYAHHIEPVADTFAYCLLGNHFHLLIRIAAVPTAHGTPSKAFSNLFNAYARSFNRAYGRTGALFQRPFGRVEVTSEAYRKHLVTYIHTNPQKHGLITDFRIWPYSSYHALTTTVSTRLQRDEVRTWFTGIDALREAPLGGISNHELAMLMPDDFN